MIITFKKKQLEDFFYDGKNKGINPQHIHKVSRILDRLHSSKAIKDMNFPGSNLHLLEPKKDKRWAVNISGNWRITFIWNDNDNDAYDVNYTDYH
ncbi:MAG: type II toxin-antitoxin system RelE/ParE family toxin [Desulfobacterales bacterium]|nr:type II toxin-antitoxin system RelE/ParE family toxin [Desulfobacterales bacterium]